MQRKLTLFKSIKSGAVIIIKSPLVVLAGIFCFDVGIILRVLMNLALDWNFNCPSLVTKRNTNLCTKFSKFKRHKCAKLENNNVKDSSHKAVGALVVF